MFIVHEQNAPHFALPRADRYGQLCAAKRQESNILLRKVARTPLQLSVQHSKCFFSRRIWRTRTRTTSIRRELIRGTGSDRGKLLRGRSLHTVVWYELVRAFAYWPICAASSASLRRVSLGRALHAGEIRPRLARRAGTDRRVPRPRRDRKRKSDRKEGERRAPPFPPSLAS